MSTTSTRGPSADGDLVTAGPDGRCSSPPRSSARWGCSRVETRKAYEQVFADGDAAGFPVLMQSHA